MKNLTLYNFTKQFLVKQKLVFILLIITHLAWTIDNTLLPYAFRGFLDALINFTGNKDLVWTAIMPWITMGGGIWFLVEIMFRVYDYLAIKFYPVLQQNIRMYMFQYLNNHSYEFFQNNFSGGIANKINDITDGLTRIMQLIITLFIPSLFAFVIGSSIFALIHPVFAAILIFWCILHIGICLFFAKKCNDYSKTHSEARSALTGKIVDNFTNIFAIKAYASEKREYQYISQYQQDETNKNQRTYRLTYKIRLLQAILCFIFQGVLSVYLMIKFWQLGIVTASDIVYMFYTGWSLTIMAWICGIELPNFFNEVGRCNQALELIRITHDVASKPDAKIGNITKGEIEFRNVTFNYKRNNNLFKNQNITLSAGTKVGLVGYSGSGKTSFVNLILRYFDINDGEILIDGQNIADIRLEDIRNKIALIPQDSLLFHRSIADNIGFAKEGASMDEIIQAAKLSHAHDFIMELPNGYDTLVGERGIKLSGGQRQRIAIARAFLKNAPIIILDEATSALDSVTEEYIQTSLEKLTKGKTTIIIAHRLSTLKNVDRILVFQKGNIIQDGTHDELLEVDGCYGDMWQKQAGGFI